MIGFVKRNYVSCGTMLLVVFAMSALGCPPDPPPPPPPSQPAPTTTTSVPTTEEWVQIPTRINYDRGSSRLNDQGRAMLAEAHSSMAHRTDIIRVRIDGHADDGGSQERNELLSRERAQNVLDYLVGTLGMPRELFEVHHHADDQPLTSGTTEADHAANRRVEFQMLVRRQAVH